MSKYEIDSATPVIKVTIKDAGPQGKEGPQGIDGPQGIQGEPFVYDDFTEEQLELLQGPQGPKGDRGDRGEKGEKGEKGDRGPQGPTGRPGEQGQPGVPGAPGPKGPMGPQGEVGPAGKDGTLVFEELTPAEIEMLKGDKGDTGPRGPQGEVGPQGPEGKRGPQGEQGIQGPRGETGEQGPQGVEGPQGPQGPQGDTGDPFEYSDFTPEQLAGLVGPEGPQGPRGEVGPAGKDGLDGKDLTDDLATHTNQQIADAETHGIRVGEEGNFEYFDGTEWVEVKGGGGGSEPTEVIDTDGEIDLSLGNRFKVVLDKPTTISIVNPQPGMDSFKLVVDTADAESPVALSEEIYWDNYEEPAFWSAKRTFFITFRTVDEGLSWYGTVDLNIGRAHIIQHYDVVGNDHRTEYLGVYTEVEIPHFNNKGIITNLSYYFQDSLVTRVINSNKNVNDVRYMFRVSRATILDLSNFDTSSVTNMSYMFYGSKATILDLSSFDTSRVTSMSNMFNNCAATILDLSNFDTSSVTNMANMFLNSAATTLDLSSFDTSNVTNMNGMFAGSKATTGYARTKADANKFNSSSNRPSSLIFVVHPDLV